MLAPWNSTGTTGLRLDSGGNTTVDGTLTVTGNTTLSGTCTVNDTFSQTVPVTLYTLDRIVHQVTYTKPTVAVGSTFMNYKALTTSNGYGAVWGVGGKLGYYSTSNWCFRDNSTGTPINKEAIRLTCQGASFPVYIGINNTEPAHT